MKSHDRRSDRAATARSDRHRKVSRPRPRAERLRQRRGRTRDHRHQCLGGGGAVPCSHSRRRADRGRLAPREGCSERHERTAGRVSGVSALKLGLGDFAGEELAISRRDRSACAAGNAGDGAWSATAGATQCMAKPPARRQRRRRRVSRRHPAGRGARGLRRSPHRRGRGAAAGGALRRRRTGGRVAQRYRDGSPRCAPCSSRIVRTHSGRWRRSAASAPTVTSRSVQRRHARSRAVDQGPD